MHILLRKGIGTCLRKIKDYQKADFGIWELHPKITTRGTYLCNKANNPKFFFQLHQTWHNGLCEKCFCSKDVELR